MLKIKNGKIGLLFWLLSSFLGSIFVVEIQRYYFNQIPGMFISLSDGIILWFIISILVLIITLPIVYTIYLLSKKDYKIANVLYTTLSIGLIVSFFITKLFTNSYFESFYITVPYFVFAFIFGTKFIRLNELK